MKRRTLKKQIPQLSQRLIKPAQAYLAATARVHQDIISKYELELERDRWLDLLFEVSTDQTTVGASRHLLYIGGKGDSSANA